MKTAQELLANRPSFTELVDRIINENKTLIERAIYDACAAGAKRVYKYYIIAPKSCDSALKEAKKTLITWLSEHGYQTIDYSNHYGTMASFIENLIDIIWELDEGAKDKDSRLVFFN